MVVGTGTVTQNYSAAEAQESNQFYENLAASSSTVTPTSGTTTVRTSSFTETTTTNFQQTTGGGSTTVYSTPPVATAASTAYKNQADQAYTLAESYRLNPDSKFGRAALDKRLADGRLTQEQYNQIVNSTPEQRIAESQVYSTQYEQARTNEIATQQSGTPVVEVTPSQNTSEISVNYQKTTSSSSTALSGTVLESNVTTTSIDGTSYQVTVNPNTNTTTYTDEFGQTVSLETTEVQSSTVVVDDNSDPYVNVATGDTTIAQQYQDVDPYVDITSDTATIARQDVIDDGSDPYVSNGATTIPLPQPQKVLPNNNPTGPAYDDEGNIMPGWSLDEENNPVWVGNNPDGSVFVEPATKASAEASRNAFQGLKAKAQSQATQRNASDLAKAGDWRVRLSLAPGADYLYKSPIESELGILAPLKATDGIIFPYTPAISVSYNASYDATELTHSNYKMYQYKASSVDNINISCDFTAQDTQEANYLLATIHFLRSVTKMFYGLDNAPPAGTPPPLLYLTGLGAFQFDRHPLAITNFNYTLPNEVDYIRAGKPASPAGVPTNTPGETNKSTGWLQIASAVRKAVSGIPFGANPAPPQWKTIQTGKVNEPTYVPTKMTIQITAVPIVSRGDISNRFGLLKYGTGDLLRGSKNNTGGIW
jgi:hypothetical protein